MAFLTGRVIKGGSFLQKRGMKRVFHVCMKCVQLLTIVNNG